MRAGYVCVLAAEHRRPFTSHLHHPRRGAVATPAGCAATPSHFARVCSPSQQDHHPAPSAPLPRICNVTRAAGVCRPGGHDTDLQRPTHHQGGRLLLHQSSDDNRLGACGHCSAARCALCRPSPLQRASPHCCALQTFPLLNYTALARAFHGIPGVIGAGAAPPPAAQRGLTHRSPALDHPGQRAQRARGRRPQHRRRVDRCDVSARGSPVCCALLILVQTRDSG